MENVKKRAALIILKYPVWGIPFAFVSMALFRLPLFFNPNLTFWRLMGCGKSGTFDKTPDLQQWAILVVWDISNPTMTSQYGMSDNAFNLKMGLGGFIARWIHFFCKSYHGYVLDPMESHGKWNGKKVFGELPSSGPYEGEIAVMTRATIRLSKLGRFWSHVDAAAEEMAQARGFVKSYGVGEWPWIKQATFSIWESKEAMRNFAYKSKHHKEIIKKTHQEKWYSEDMFTRFSIVAKFC